MNRSLGSSCSACRSRSREQCQSEDKKSNVGWSLTACTGAKLRQNERHFKHDRSKERFTFDQLFQSLA